MNEQDIVKKHDINTDENKYIIIISVIVIIIVIIILYYNKVFISFAQKPKSSVSVQPSIIDILNNTDLINSDLNSGHMDQDVWQSQQTQNSVYSNFTV